MIWQIISDKASGNATQCATFCDRGRPVQHAAMRRQGHAKRIRGTQIFPLPQVPQFIFRAGETQVFPRIPNLLAGLGEIEDRQ